MRYSFPGDDYAPERTAVFVPGVPGPASSPGALLHALAILSPEGQNVMAANGFRPIGLPGD
jgi:hypothetical protein